METEFAIVLLTDESRVSCRYIADICLLYDGILRYIIILRYYGILYSFHCDRKRQLKSEPSDKQPIKTVSTPCGLRDQEQLCTRL